MAYSNSHQTDWIGLVPGASTTRGRGRNSKPRGGRGGGAKYAAVVQTKSNSQKH